jgi:hypothetical protein
MFPNLPTSLASLMQAGLPSLTAGLASSALAAAARTPSQARSQQAQLPPPPPLTLTPHSSETPIRPKPSRTPSNDLPPVKMTNPSFSLPPGAVISLYFWIIYD